VKSAVSTAVPRIAPFATTPTTGVSASGSAPLAARFSGT
jgi:hypothetical protein